MYLFPYLSHIKFNKELTNYDIALFVGIIIKY